MPTTFLPLTRIRLLDGPFKRRQDTNARYLLTVIEPDRLLAPFRAQAGLPPKAERYGGWESRDISGHSLGHYLTALSHLYAVTGDAEALRRIDHIVDELAACQRADTDGYVLPVDKNAFTLLRAGQINASPFALNGVWVPFYTLHKLLAGLRDAHRLAASQNALPVARALADWLNTILSDLTPGQIQTMLRCEHGGMNEVLADLTADTGDARYAQMAARCFHHAAVLDPMFQGEDRLNGLHGNTQIPKLVGLAREYELTREPRYHTAATSFWSHVVCERSYATGGHGESEHFFPPAQFPQRLTARTCETCNSNNMLRLTRHLFEWQPTAAQMDYVERTLVNHLAANIGQHPGEFGYFLGLDPASVKVFSTPLDSWWCCVGTGMENPARYGEHIYAHDLPAPTSTNTPTLWINQYIASTLDWQEAGVHMYQETEYPDSEIIRIKITTTDKQPRRFTLKLRHPSWCAAPTLKLNNHAPAATATTASSYITLTREWHDNDTLELHLPMTLHAESLPHSDGKTLAFMFGPSLLAAVIPDAPGFASPAKQRFSDHLKARGKTDTFPPHLVAPDTAAALSNLHPIDNRFAEFYADNTFKPDTYAHLTFIPLHRIYEEQYSVYFHLHTPAEWIARESEIRAAREKQQCLEASTLDTVTPGYQQPEIEHALREHRSEIGDAFDRKYRLARDAGWFSYELTVSPGAPVTLLATYWGGVWDKREFDILVDDHHLATQHLLNDKPGDFLDIPYPIPANLTRNKTKITVRIASRPATTTGELFHLRTMCVDLPAANKPHP